MGRGHMSYICVIRNDNNHYNYHNKHHNSQQQKMEQEQEDHSSSSSSSSVGYMYRHNTYTSNMSLIKDWWNRCARKILYYMRPNDHSTANLKGREELEESEELVVYQVVHKR